MDKSIDKPERSKDDVRPYMCTVVGCSKRYKNLNGLKVKMCYSIVFYYF